MILRAMFFVVGVVDVEEGHGQITAQAATLSGLSTSNWFIFNSLVTRMRFDKHIFHIRIEKSGLGTTHGDGFNNMVSISFHSSSIDLFLVPVVISYFLTS